MFVLILQITLGLVLAYFVWSMVAMEKNYQRASSMGIPLVRLPVDPINTLWIVFEKPIWKLLDLLPISFGSFGVYGRRGWQFNDKANSHLRYGPIWAHVTPAGIHISVADAGAIQDVLFRRNDFVRPSELYKMLGVYGPCISTASESDWPRHRKALAMPFNESIMKFVWDESLVQARDMLSSWTHGPQKDVSFSKDTRTLSLNILAATGFRRSYGFRSSREPVTNENATYRDALATVLDNVILLMLFPYKMLSFPVFPKEWRRIGQAGAAFKKYMEQMLDEETTRLEQGEKGSGGLMTSFVRALNTNQKEAGGEGVQKGLTIPEIFGNIFVINFAGHDTTANTLAFCMVLLSCYPEVQEWVGEELQEVIRDRETWEYEELFPKLKRCRSILFETMRVFPPILALPKWTNEFPQTLRVGEREIEIPPNTGVMPAVLAVQTHPTYWEEPLLWKPSRWISSPSGSSNLAAQLEKESLITPLRGSFIAWSDGPHNCLGEKFAHVEFVIVLACLLKSHRVSVVRNIDESLANAKKRALACAHDCDWEMLLRMRNPDQVKLVWKKV